jgi:hypothetical protein
LTELNPLTEPKRVRTVPLRRDEVEQNGTEQAQPPTTPDSLNEPKRVRTITIRSGRAEEKHSEQNPAKPP